MSFDNEGQSFKKNIPKINLSNGNDYIEAKINLEPTNRVNKAKQNVISMGEDIKVWSTGGDGKHNIHFYYPNSESNDHLLRFSAVIGEKINNATRRTKGIIKIPNEILTIRVDKNGISIDNHYISRFSPNNLNTLKNSGEEGNYKFVTEDDRPSNTYEYFVSNYLILDQVLLNWGVGSMEGSTRSWASYEYVKYHFDL